jgi:putative transposase
MPEIFNTDQGSLFASDNFTGMLKNHGVKISMQGPPFTACERRRRR